MGTFQEAKQLTAHAKEQLVAIRQAYEVSLRNREINPQLLIAIKNFMENLRSALDYCAQGLYDQYGTPKATRPNVYFPYAMEGQTLAQFRKAKRVETCIPGLIDNRPDIADVLESVQAFACAENTWLPRFMKLNNENKHQALTPQTRTETKELRISGGNASMSVGPHGQVSVAPGCTVTIGGKRVIPGGQSFDIDSPPVTIGPGKTEVINWVSFEFQSNGEPVLSFLETAASGTARIVQELQRL